MADEEKKPSVGKKLFKIFLMLFLLLVLIAGGFAIGIYMQLFNAQTAGDKLGLNKLPVVGQYFDKPKAETDADMQNKPVQDAKPNPADAKKPDNTQQQPQKLTLTKEEIAKQMQERQAAEKKRVTQIARLYSDMRPQDAATAMDSLNDDMVVAILQRMDDDNAAAKILAAFDPARTARLTQIMYQGTQQTAVTPEDIQNGQNLAGDTSTSTTTNNTNSGTSNSTNTNAQQ